MVLVHFFLERSHVVFSALSILKKVPMTHGFPRLPSEYGFNQSVYLATLRKGNILVLFIAARCLDFSAKDVVIAKRRHLIFK